MFPPADPGCVCQRCGNHYRVDVNLPDALWNSIRPAGKPKGAGLLCGRCIFVRIENFGEFAAFKLEPV